MITNTQLWITLGIPIAAFVFIGVMFIRQIKKTKAREAARAAGIPDPDIEVTIRKTLEPVNIYRQLEVSELRVGECVSLRDEEKNGDTLFVFSITPTAVIFESSIARNKKYQLILHRNGDTLSDEKGRIITVQGNAPSVLKEVRL